jgi:hypothetical protein
VNTGLNSLLLDANVIIKLHELKIWDKFYSVNKIHVASSIVRDRRGINEPGEAHCAFLEKGERIDYDLRSDVAEGKIIEVYCDPSEIKRVQDKLDSLNGPNIQMGELESITYLVKEEKTDIKFCTADEAAIKALVLLGIKHKAISLEKALEQCGLGREFKDHFSKRCLKKWIKNAEIERIYNFNFSADDKKD